MKSLLKIPDSGKSAIVYTMSSLFSRGLAIITVPIFTRIMTTSQIGTINIYNSWYAMISMFATLSLTSGGYIVALKEYSDHRDQYESSVLSLTSFVAVVIAIIYFVSPQFWCQLLGLPNSLLLLMLVGFFFAPARDFWLVRQRFEYKYIVPAIVTISTGIFASVLSILVVLHLNSIKADGVAEGRLFANYIVLYGVCIVLWFYIIIKGKTIINLDYWKFSLKLSIPLIGYAIAAQVLNVSDRAMIGKLVDDSAVGIYGTLYSVSSLTTLVWSALHTSFVPYLFNNMENKSKKKNIQTISFLLLFIYAIAAVMITYLGPEIVRVIATDEYYSAVSIMPPIAVGIFFTSFANLYSDIVVYYKKTKYVMYPTIIAAITNVILNYYFIKLFGYTAAAYTTLVSFILLSIFQVYWAKKACREITNTKQTVFNDHIFCALAIATTLACMFGLVLYKFTVLRYAIILAFFVMIAFAGLFVYKKGIDNIFSDSDLDK